MRRVDEAGILVAANGIVGNDTHRKLNRDESTLAAGVILIRAAISRHR
jgi:hypothetical protein